MDRNNHHLNLFHGSHTLFSEFSKDVDPRFSTSQYELGHYLTDCVDQAKMYASLHIHEIESMLGKEEFDLTDDEISNCESEHIGYIYNVEICFQSLKIENALPSGLSKIEEMQHNWNEDRFLAYKNSLIAEGYDGVQFLTNDGHSEFVIFLSKNVKIQSVEKMMNEDLVSYFTPSL